MTTEATTKGQKLYAALMNADTEKRDMALEVIMSISGSARLGLRSARALFGALDGLLIADGPRPECIRINCETLASLARNANVIVEYFSSIGSMMRAASAFAEHPDVWEGVNHDDDQR
jgi:hypothetical protein